DEVEIDLSSLVFANDEPNPEQVAGVLRNLDSGAEVPVGEFDVDASIVNTNDEMGRTTVKFAIPENDAPEEDSESWVLEIIDDLELLELALDISIEEVSDEAPPPT